MKQFMKGIAGYIVLFVFCFSSIGSELYAYTVNNSDCLRSKSARNTDTSNDLRMAMAGSGTDNEKTRDGGQRYALLQTIGGKEVLHEGVDAAAIGIRVLENGDTEVASELMWHRRQQKGNGIVERAKALLHLKSPNPPNVVISVFSPDGSLKDKREVVLGKDEIKSWENRREGKLGPFARFPAAKGMEETYRDKYENIWKLQCIRTYFNSIEEEHFGIYRLVMQNKEGDVQTIYDEETTKPGKGDFVEIRQLDNGDILLRLDDEIRRIDLRTGETVWSLSPVGVYWIKSVAIDHNDNLWVLYSGPADIIAVYGAAQNSNPVGIHPLDAAHLDAIYGSHQAQRRGEFEAVNSQLTSPPYHNRGLDQGNPPDGLLNIARQRNMQITEAEFKKAWDTFVAESYVEMGVPDLDNFLKKTAKMLSDGTLDNSRQKVVVFSEADMKLPGFFLTMLSEGLRDLEAVKVKNSNKPVFKFAIYGENVNSEALNLISQHSDILVARDFSSLEEKLHEQGINDDDIIVVSATAAEKEQLNGYQVRKIIAGDIFTLAMGEAVKAAFSGTQGGTFALNDAFERLFLAQLVNKEIIPIDLVTAEYKTLVTEDIDVDKALDLSAIVIVEETKKIEIDTAKQAITEALAVIGL